MGAILSEIVPDDADPVHVPSPAERLLDALGLLPVQYPMPGSWETSSVPSSPSRPRGCGVHEPSDYTQQTMRDHWRTCRRGRTRCAGRGLLGPDRLHDALDLADRTSHTRKPGKKRDGPPKRVRFAMDLAPSVFETSTISYLATDPAYERPCREADRVAYYCTRVVCAYEAVRLFRSQKEADGHFWEVQRARRARMRARRIQARTCGRLSGENREILRGGEVGPRGLPIRPWLVD